MDTPTSGQCYGYAAACVDVGRNVIHNTREMEKQNTIAGPYWFSIYTTFCATLSLIFYIWENADVQGTLQTLNDAEYGRDVLVKLAYKSMAAARHPETLAVSSEPFNHTLSFSLTIIQTVFNRLPEKLGKSQRNQSTAHRKRHTPLSNQNDGHNFHDNKDMETPYDSFEYLQEANSSTNSRVSTQRTDVVDLGESPPLDVPLNPMHFATIPERPPHSNFARFLGPDSIEDLFRPESEYSGDFVPLNIDSSLSLFLKTLTL